LNRLLITVCAAVLLLLAALPVAYLSWPARVPVSAAISQGAEIGGPFELQDQHGQPVNESSFKGRWTLVFFGFTHCPDVCPTAMTHVARTLDSLGEQAGQVQPLFITLDPERDTPEVLSEYTAFFDQRILGLFGSEGQTRQVADAYSVYFEKIPMGDTYMLDHTATLYLMGPDGQFVQHYSQQMSAEAMAEDIAVQLATFPADSNSNAEARNGL
tara:strand:- start:29157 stop:29798 length:642 start_codon:yes stop_codon:yes gene_type:complete